MAIDMVTLALAKNYVDTILENAGSLKGKNCTIKSITETNTGNEVIFQWENDDGTIQTSTMTVKNGVDGAKGDKGDKGDTGEKGANGVSPTITTAQTDTGATITITDANGTKTVTLLNGQDGAKGDKGDTGAKGDTGDTGSNGIDGKSVTAIALVKDDTGVIVSGTATLSDNSTIEISITTA